MPAERIDFERDATGLPASDANSMAEMLERYLRCPDLEHGQVMSGAVVRVTPNSIIVDIGAKCEGIVPERDLEKLSPAERGAIQVGDEVVVSVVTPEDANGNIILSLSRAQLAQDWHKAMQILQSQETIERQVAACNKGGVIVRFGRIRGFVPGSQLAVTHVADQSASGQSEDNRWSSLISETLQLKVIEVDQKRNRLILSERAALRDRRKNQREKLLGDLTEGDVRRGKVINLADFGAFVDIGGVDGLVHLSELSWKRVAHPSEVVEIGQEIEVYVLKVHRERQRVALSLKRLQPDPWDSATERYREGQVVEGIITRLTKWGAFASIVGDEAIEGLIHVSELAEGPVVHPRDVIQPGQIITLRVIGVDQRRHRMALSLKRADQAEYLDQDWKAMLATEQPESPLSAALSQTIGNPQETDASERRGGQ